MAEITIQQAFDLALRHHQAGQLREAEQLYRQVLARKPDSAEAHSNLGVVLTQAARLHEAIAAFRRAVALNPAYAQAHSNLGVVLKDTGQLDEAVAAFRQAIALMPAAAEAHNNLGNTLKDKGQLDQAVVAFRQAIALKPDYADAHSNLGVALTDAGRFDDAIAALRQAIALKPSSAEAHTNLGNALRDNGQLDDAIAACSQAIALRPADAQAYCNLGVALAAAGQLDRAIIAFRQAIAFDRNFSQGYNNLGNLLKEQGRLDEAIAAYQAAITLRPADAQAHSNLLLSLHYLPDCDPQTILEEHRGWNRQHALPLRQFIKPHLNDRSADRRLRIGYLSPDFRDHAVARFLLPLLAHHDKREVEVFAYSNVRIPDATTEQLRAHVNTWRRIAGVSDADAAELIRADQIDILVDLAGHTAGNRLTLMARKPAPIQVTWLGYPNTTGLSTIDYRLTDALADPPGETEKYHTEKLVHLPDGMWCYSPDPEAPPVAASPAAAGGGVVFGSLSQRAKINENVLSLWGRLLNRVPGSRLLLKDIALDDIAGRRLTLDILGVTEDRVRFLDRAPTDAQYLAQYQLMDIALDPFPYNGTTTTCQALWMGLPVVVLAGRTHAARVGVSLLTRIGLSELIARTPEQYVEIAAELANDVPRLTALRSSLRDRMRASPLMDGRRFAGNVEAAYRRMWRSWCESIAGAEGQQFSPLSRYSGRGQG